MMVILSYFNIPLIHLVLFLYKVKCRAYNRPCLPWSAVDNAPQQEDNMPTNLRISWHNKGQLNAELVVTVATGHASVNVGGAAKCCCNLLRARRDVCARRYWYTHEPAHLWCGSDTAVRG